MLEGVANLDLLERPKTGRSGYAEHGGSDELSTIASAKRSSHGTAPSTHASHKA